MTDRPKGIPTFEMKRPLRVLAMRAILTVGFLEDRPDLRALATLAAREHGRLDVDRVHRALLATLPRLVAQRFLTSASWLGLFEASADGTFVLTALGHRAQSEPVFIPQEGLWTLWATDDPLVPPSRRILRIEPCVRPRGQKDERPSAMPPSVVEALGIDGEAPWSPAHHRFCIAPPGDGVIPQCVTIESNARVTLTLRTSAASVEVRLDGTIEVGDDRAPEEVRGNTRLENPGHAQEEIWATALGARSGEWRDGQLGVRFTELDDDARATFQRNVRFSSWQHPKLGTFGPFEVRGVPVRPAAQADADAWARWTLERRVDGYGTEEAWRRWCESVRTTFEGVQVSLPTQRELAASLSRSGEPHPIAYWHLFAPIDLQPRSA